MKVKNKDKTIMSSYGLTPFSCFICNKTFLLDKFKFIIPKDGDYIIDDSGLTRTIKAKNCDFIQPSYTCPDCGERYELLINGKPYIKE